MQAHTHNTHTLHLYVACALPINTQTRDNEAAAAKAKQPETPPAISTVLLLLLCHCQALTLISTHTDQLDRARKISDLSSKLTCPLQGNRPDATVDRSKKHAISPSISPCAVVFAEQEALRSEATLFHPFAIDLDQPAAISVA